TVLQVTTHIMEGMAATALMLLGLLPIYVAYVLGLIVFEAPSSGLVPMIYAGLGLPFIAGLWGLRTIYRGFMQLADTLARERRCRRRRCLRRLTVGWPAGYSAVTPVGTCTVRASLSR